MQIVPDELGHSGDAEHHGYLQSLRHHHHEDEDEDDDVTARAGLEAAVDHVGRVHARQRRWRTWHRVAWWMLLLPLALACWAALQQTRPRQLAVWTLAGVALLTWIGAATGSSSQPRESTASTLTLRPPALLQTSTSTTSSRPVLTTSSNATSPSPSPSLLPSPSPPASPSPSAATARAAVVPVVPPAAAVVAPPVVAPAPVATETTKAPQPLLTQTTTAPAPPPGAESFGNCAALNAIYPHGVGRPDAADHVSGSTKPVTTFTRSTALYEANVGRDRDQDDIACEKA